MFNSIKRRGYDTKVHGLCQKFFWLWGRNGRKSDFETTGTQAVSHGVAGEGAHGVSRGEKCAIAKSLIRGDSIPAKGGIIFRRFAAPIPDTSTHG